MILQVDSRSNHLVMLRLLESHCIPILAYAMEIVHVENVHDRRELRVAYNSVFRNIFCYTRRQSVTNLQHTLGCPTWEELVEKRKSNFTCKFMFLRVVSLVLSNLPCIDMYKYHFDFCFLCTGPLHYTICEIHII